MYFIGNKHGEHLRRLSKRVATADVAATAMANECLVDIRTVRAFAMEDTEIGRYQALLAQAHKLHMTFGLQIGLFQGLSHTAMGFTVLLVLFKGGMMVASKELTSGALMSYLLSTQSLQKSLGSLLSLYSQLMKAHTAGSRIFSLFALKPRRPLRGGHTLPALAGQIEFREVNFAYPTSPNHPVLKNFELVIPAGAIIAVCGPSGSGKSTLAAVPSIILGISDHCC